MNNSDRFGLKNQQEERKENIVENLHKKHGKKFVLFAVTLALWLLIIIITISITNSSRNFEFDGNSLRITSYVPRYRITAVDNNGNNFNLTATGVRRASIGAEGTFTVEYLGETFEHRISLRTIHQDLLPTVNLPNISQTSAEPEVPPTARRLAEIAFIEHISGTVYRGPVSISTAVLCIVISFFVLLLSISACVYPHVFWEFEQAFNFRVQNAEPTEWGILVHQLGGGVFVVLTFIIVIVALTT